MIKELNRTTYDMNQMTISTVNLEQFILIYEAGIAEKSANKRHQKLIHQAIGNEYEKRNAALTLTS